MKERKKKNNNKRKGFAVLVTRLAEVAIPLTHADTQGRINPFHVVSCICVLPSHGAEMDT
jgi:hypothetical protein